MGQIGEKVSAGSTIVRPFIVTISFLGLVVAALFIAYGEALGLDPAVDPRKWRSLAIFFAANAAALALTPQIHRIRWKNDEEGTEELVDAISVVTMMAGPFLLFTFAIVELCLIGSVIVNRAFEASWTFLFVLPIAANLFVTLTSASYRLPQDPYALSPTDQADHDQADHGQPDQSTPETDDTDNTEDDANPAITAQNIRERIDDLAAEQTRPAGMTPYISSALLMVAFSIGAGGLFFLGNGLFFILDALIIHDRVVTTADIIANFDETVDEFGLEIVLNFLWVIMVVLGSGLVVFAMQRALRANNPYYDRMLDSSDYSFLERSFFDLIEYLEARQYPGWYLIYNQIFNHVLIFAGMGGFGAALYFATDALHDLLLTIRAADETIYQYTGHGYSATAMAVAAGFMLPVFVQKLTAWLFPAFGEAMFTLEGGDETSTGKKQPVYLALLMRHLRLGKVGPTQAFEPQAYLRMAARDNERPILLAFAGLWGLVFLCLFLDLRAYKLISETGVERVSWFSPTKTDLAWQNLDSVVLECRDVDDDGTMEIRLDYNLVLPDGTELDQLSSSPDTDEIDVLAAIDGHIRAAGVPLRAHAERFDPACPALLAEYLEPEKAERLQPVMTPTSAVERGTG